MVPGVLLVTVDTWRADHLTADISPEAHALAERGLFFETAYTTIGLTTPAHASLFTGLLPPDHGLRGNNHHGYRLESEYTTLAEHFTAAGWATGAFVSAFPAGPSGGLDQGFQVFDGPEQGERATAITLEAARKWLSEQQTPWFLWVHAYEPHGPYTPPESAIKDSDPPGEKGAYAGEIRGVDRILGPLYRQVLAADGWVILTSDHGEILDEEPCHWQHARSSSDAVLRIPLVLAGPGIAPKQVTTPVGITDLFPTLLSIGGIADPGGHHGHSLLNPPANRSWFAESGLCEPDCSPGCAPAGFLGKDLVHIAGDQRTVLRPGTPTADNPEVQKLFENYGKPNAPKHDSDAAMGRALGYLEPE